MVRFQWSLVALVVRIRMVSLQSTASYFLSPTLLHNILATELSDGKLLVPKIRLHTQPKPVY
jgi:hypothetical protein